MYALFSYNYYLWQFLNYNQRRVAKDWRNEHEELIVKRHEEMYAELAAAAMPETLFLPALQKVVSE